MGIIHAFDTEGGDALTRGRRARARRPCRRPGRGEGPAGREAEEARHPRGLPKARPTSKRPDPRRDGQTLYSLDIDAGTITASRRSTDGTAARSAKVGDRPYDVAVARNGSKLLRLRLGRPRVLAVDPADLRVVGRIAVGEHPNQIAVHPKDDRLFVACASSNSVSVIDTRRGIVTETIVTALFPLAPEGSTPDALAVAPDGKTLYVANADNNCVAVDRRLRRRRGARSRASSRPAGIRRRVAVTPDGKRLLVGVGKGNQTKPNPIAEADGRDRPVGQSAGRSRCRSPTSARPSRAPSRSSPSPTTRPSPPTPRRSTELPLLRQAPRPTPRRREKTAIPTKVGDPSPIKQ